MENKQIVSALIGIAIIGALSGLVLENMIEGDAAKFRQFANKIKDNTLILFETAQMATVQNMISHAKVSFELSTAISDPDLIPNNGDEYILNQVSECVFYSPDDIPFPTCLICQISDEECKEKVVCPVCARPTIFTVLYENPNQVQGDVVNIDVKKGNKILAQFFGVTDGTPLEINAENFPDGKMGDTTPTNTEYHISINNVVTEITIHTSCSKGLFVGDVHTRDDTNTGDPDVSLTVVSGTDANLNPTIPDASCKDTTDSKASNKEPKEKKVKEPKSKTPTIFTVLYNNPNQIQGDYVTIEVYKNDKDFGKHNKILAEFFGVVDGQEITIDSRDFINKDKDKVEKKTVYRILVNGYETTVIIHTSDSKDLFVGDEHTTDPDTTGDADISLTVVSGTDANLNPTISDASNKSK
jgi:hypothetical protein